MAKKVGFNWGRFWTKTYNTLKHEVKGIEKNHSWRWLQEAKSIRAELAEHGAQEHFTEANMLYNIEDAYNIIEYKFEDGFKSIH